MMRYLLLLAFIGLLGSACSSKHNRQKMHPNDPFKKEMVKSQYFEFSGAKDTVIEGKNGTIIVAPKGSYTDASGKIYEGPIRLELAEALSLEERLSSNIATAPKEKQLNADAAVYLNASTPDGKPLEVNKNNPIYVQIPTADKKPNMKAFRSERDANGNMIRKDAKPLEDYLITCPLDSLDFLPEGFAFEANKHYTIASQKQVDFLYYALANFDNSSYPSSPVRRQQEAFYNEHKKIVNGLYTKESYFVDTLGHGSNSSMSHSEPEPAYPYFCRAINPLSIQALKTKKFQNTFIATRAFEARMRALHKTCCSGIFDIYLNHLDKNLWEADEAVALALEKEKKEFVPVFKKFAGQKLGKVKDGDTRVELLKKHYEKSMAANKAILEAKAEKMKKAIERKEKDWQKLNDEYQEILWQREKHRMESYAFEWTNNGWVEIAGEERVNGWAHFEATIKNGKEYDRVESYIFFKYNASLYHLNSADYQTHFFVGNSNQRQMLMMPNTQAVLIAVGYKGESVAAAIQDFTTHQDKFLSLQLKPTDKEGLKNLLAPYDPTHTKGKDINRFVKSEIAKISNSIELDLKYQKAIQKARKEALALTAEWDKMESLYLKANAACNNSDGKALFEKHCAACHSNGKAESTGPSLVGATSRQNMGWIVRFTRNPSAVLADGDAYGARLYAAYSNTVMTPFPELTDEDILAIMNYIDEINVD